VIDGLKIIQSKKWLGEFMESLKGRNFFTSKQSLQHKYIAKPLSNYFPHVNPNEILDYLHVHGLFYGNEEKEVEKFLSYINENKIEKFILKELKKLQKEWGGPNCNIFLFPITNGNKSLVSQLGGKSGIGFSDKIILFFNDSVSKKGLKALATHEYHHVCRIKKSKKELKNFTLLDSLLIEGLAEVAVEEYVGEDYLAAWVNIYDEKKLQHYWEKVMRPNLNIVGKQYHHQFLYGEEGNLPKWIGYSIGYHIIKSILKKNSTWRTMDLLNKKSEELLAKSSFKGQ
jgi:uncharacterized protein YjaZ